MRAALLACFALLSGCVAPPPPPPLPPPQQAASAKPRLWYVGLGLYDESWSEGDVVATASALAQRAPGFEVVPILFSYGATRHYPFPDRINIDQMMANIAQRAGPNDVVLLYLSTHGAPGILGREESRRQLPSADVAEVQEWLAPLGHRPTVLVLSACFSGSFIPALQAENRIILAAARPDRTSFGCRAGAEHTVFGDALLDALATPSISLRDLVQRVRADVSAREHELGVRRPSEPQVSIGAAETSLYAAPVF